MNNRYLAFLSNSTSTPAIVGWVLLLSLSLSLPSNAEDAVRFANFNRYADSNAQLSSLPPVPGRVVLMGNSITDFWPARAPHLFQTHPEIIGRGIAGQTTWQFLLRFRADVIDLNPETVVLNYGTNDIALNAGEYDEDATFGNVRSMVDLARANGIKVILASCLPAQGFSWRPEVKDAMDKIRRLNTRVKAYAEAEDIPYADYFSALVNDCGTSMDSAYSDESPAVHPNAAGYTVMERILLDALHEVHINDVCTCNTMR